MPHAARSRVIIVFLLLALLALPALGQRQASGRALGQLNLLSSLWRAVVQFVSGLAQPPDRDAGSSTTEGDLGPGLDPLGRG